MARENLTDHLDINEKKDKIRQRLWKIRAKKVIIATGAMERPLILNNNDIPGIILSYSIKKYIDYYGVKCGQRISLFTNNDSAYEAAISLNNSGVIVNSVIDIRDKTNSLIIKQAEKLGIKIHWRSTVVNTYGYKKINSFERMWYERKYFPISFTSEEWNDLAFLIPQCSKLLYWANIE